MKNFFYIQQTLFFIPKFKVFSSELKIKMNKSPKWNIEKGDYKRDIESTNTFLIKANRKRIIKSVTKAVLFILLIVLLVLLFMGELKIY
jgi:hypothetical protein